MKVFIIIMMIVPRDHIKHTKINSCTAKGLFSISSKFEKIRWSKFGQIFPQKRLYPLSVNRAHATYS